MSNPDETVLLKGAFSGNSQTKDLRHLFPLLAGPQRPPGSSSMGGSADGWGLFWRAFQQNISRAIKMFRAFDLLILVLGSWLRKTITSMENLHTVTSVYATEKLETVLASNQR